VARDAATGELGVGVQSHWFSVGSGVLWAEPGIGAVATQSFTDPDYGPLGLQLMRGGKSAAEALAALVGVDEHANVRQVGMVDADGIVANHTGQMSIDEHCEIAGDNFTVQANLMWKPTVCDAMVTAYASAQGDLAERMMVALEAVEQRAAICAANSRRQCWLSAAIAHCRRGPGVSWICASRTMQRHCSRCADC